MISKLKDVFAAAVKPKELQNVIDDVINKKQTPQNASQEYNVLRPFVEYQVRKYGEANERDLVKDWDDCLRDFSNEGFQVGGAWVGEIGKEKILFLSSNPGFTTDHCNPRYMYNTDTIEIQGQAITDKDLIKYLEYPLVDISDTVPHKLMHIKNEKSAKPLLSIKKNQPSTLRGIRYWNDLVYKFLAELYLYHYTGFDLQRHWFTVRLKNTRRNRPDHGRNIAVKNECLCELVKKALFTEIIPFGSVGQDGVNDDSLQFCWENYSSRILYYSVAKIWVIVGGHAREQFSKIIQSPANCPIQNLECYNLKGNTWDLHQQSSPLEVDNCYRGNFGPQKEERLILTVRHTNAHGKGGYFKDSIKTLLVEHPGLRQEINKRL